MNGELKRLLKVAFADALPNEIKNRKDKMGFPVPLNDWMKSGGRTKNLVMETLGAKKAKERFYLNEKFNIEEQIQKEATFNRNIWGLLNLEICQNKFIDNHKCILKE